MTSVEEAESLILKNLPSPTSEQVDLKQALGRTLHEVLHADRALPPFDRSTMDGIAIDSASYHNSTHSFPITGVAAAGQAAINLNDSSTCVEIMTGAPLPIGADCVVRIEDVEIKDGIAHVIDGLPLTAGYAVHPEGSDCKKGQILLSPGVTLSGKELAIAASIGKTVLTVSRQPRIAIVATGNELIEVDQTPAPHQIRRSNDTALSSAIKSAGYPNVTTHHLPDDREIIETKIADILKSCDVLIIAGGISKGKFDFLPKALEHNKAKEIFQWVSQRPGKPLYFGTCQQEERSVPIFALPGNPVSAFTCLHRYALPALATMTGRNPTLPEFAQLTGDFRFKAPLTFFLPVSIETDPTGTRLATPAPFNTSGDFASVAKTHGFLELPKDLQTFPTGQAYRFFPWH